MRSRWFLLGVANAVLLITAIPAGAQPGRVDHRTHADGPTEAPPPPREEHAEARAGFEWIPGRWDWRANRWQWTAGHLEKEHAGQHWHPGHWDRSGATWAWTEGAWAAGAMPPGEMPPPGAPPPGEMPPPGAIPRPHEWHLDRPTVSSYWPMKGKPGTRVVIHGENFPADAQVLWGPTPVMAVKIAPDRITFEVPPAAPSATIMIKHGGHDLVVGNFEVASFDADAEAKRIEAQRVAAAQTAWAASQAAMAKNQAGRQTALDTQYQQLEANRDQRREQRAQEIRAKWKAAFLADPDTQAELTLHAQRIADLQRAKDLAGVTSNAKLGVRIDVATARENDRHDQRMAALQTAFEAKGGAK